MPRQINEFNFTIGGEIEQIDVKSLSATLLSLETALQQINKELGTNKELNLTVKTYKPGSFDIYLQVLSDMTALGIASGIFNPEGLETAKTVIDALTSILNLKKFLRGQKPKDVKPIGGNQTTITNNYGNVLIVTDLTLQLPAKNEGIDESISKIFDTLNAIPYVRGLSIKDSEEKEIFESEKAKNDFTAMALPLPMKEEIEEKTKDKFITNATLSVYSIVFNDTSKWQFFYEGNKIPAKLKDASFLEKVMEHEIRFGNGDKLICEMTIHQKYNQIADTYENKSYTITKVNDVITPGGQKALGV